MRSKLRIALATVALSSLVYAGSEAAFPTDWKNFTSMSTPLTSIGALPGCDADVSALPAIYQETVATYCAVKPGGPGAVAVTTNKPEEFKKRSGTYSDDLVSVLHLKDLKVLFVTQWKDNEALYGIYTEDGKDAANAVGSGLHPQDCKTCHTGYAAFCNNGLCATAK